MRIIRTLVAALTLLAPASGATNATEKPFLSKGCQVAPTAQQCRKDILEGLQRAIALFGSPQVSETIPLLSKKKGVYDLCVDGVHVLRIVDKEISLLWRYLMLRQRSWSDSMRADILAAAKQQLLDYEKKHNKRRRGNISDAEALQFVTDRLPGSGARTNCGWKTYWFGGFAKKNVLKGQAKMPAIAADVARIIRDDLKQLNTQHVSVGIIFLRVLDNISR